MQKTLNLEPETLNLEPETNYCLACLGDAV